MRVHGLKKALAVTSDCTPRYVFSDPYEGGKQAVAEAWRNLTSVGADPIAITDNLNFGNPERPEIMGQIVGAIEGMAEACRTLNFLPSFRETCPALQRDQRRRHSAHPHGRRGRHPARSAHDRRAGFSAGQGRRPHRPGLGMSRGELGSSLYLRELLRREEAPSCRRWTWISKSATATSCAA